MLQFNSQDQEKTLTGFDDTRFSLLSLIESFQKLRLQQYYSALHFWLSGPISVNPLARASKLPILAPKVKSAKIALSKPQDPNFRS